jgi:hypothetical protein
MPHKMEDYTPTNRDRPKKALVRISSENILDVTVMRDAHDDVLPSTHTMHTRSPISTNRELDYEATDIKHASNVHEAVVITT